MYAASGFSLVSLWFQAEKGTLSSLECLSFANNIQADLPISLKNLTKCEEVRMELIRLIVFYVRSDLILIVEECQH